MLAWNKFVCSVMSERYCKNCVVRHRFDPRLSEYSSVSTDGTTLSAYTISSFSLSSRNMSNLFVYSIALLSSHFINKNVIGHIVKSYLHIETAKALTLTLL